MRTLLLMATALFLSGAARMSWAEDAESKDRFAAGAVWAGDVRVANKKEPGKALLTVSERTGEAFKGELSVRNPAGKVMTFEVSGTATSKSTGAVIFETQKQGLAQLKMRGKLKDNAVTLVFVGTNPFAEKGGGALVLTPKL